MQLWYHFKKRFEDVVVAKNNHRLSWTMPNIDVGLTRNNKLEHICPHFHQIDGLYGDYVLYT